MLVGVLVGVLLVTAGCGAGPASRPSPSVPPSVATAESNRRAAEREAQRLVTLVPTPPGASPVASPGTRLAGPASRPMVDSLAVRSAFWSVPLPYEQAAAWIEAHPPHGLAWPGHGGTSGGGSAPTRDWSAWAPASTAWESAQAEANLVGTGPATSLLRVDGVVVWLDPTPLPDRADGGGRVRLAVAGSCPASEQGITGVTAAGPGLDAALLPGPAPTGGLVCRYAGLNATVPLHLTATQRLDAARAAALATRVLALPLGHADGEVRSCPGDDGAAVLVALAYPARDDVDLWITTAGCTSVANGRILAAAPRDLVAP